MQFHDRLDTPVKAAALTFLGPLLGSLLRPVGGRLADRYGGAPVTLVTFAAMGAGTAVVPGARSRRVSTGRAPRPPPGAGPPH